MQICIFYMLHPVLCLPTILLSAEEGGSIGRENGSSPFLVYIGAENIGIKDSHSLILFSWNCFPPVTWWHWAFFLAYAVLGLLTPKITGLSFCFVYLDKHINNKWFNIGKIWKVEEKKIIHRFNRLVKFLVEFSSCFAIYLVFVTYLCSLCIF